MPKHLRKTLDKKVNKKINSHTGNYKAIVIGAGNIGAAWEADHLRPTPATHAGAYIKNKFTTLAAIVDVNEERLIQAKRIFHGVQTYTDVENCLREIKPDIVSIATPANTHESLFKLCANYGIKAIVCEKPASENAESAERMLDIARQKGIIVIINHQRHFFDSFMRLRNKIMLGEFGKIQQVTTYYSNGLINNGSHTVDALNFLLNDRVNGVIGVVKQNNKVHIHGDVNIDGLLFFENGTVATMQSLDNSKFGIHDFTLIGEKAMIIIRDYGYRIEIIPVKKSKTFSGLNQLDYTGIKSKKYVTTSMVSGSINCIVNCLMGKSSPDSTLFQSVHTLKVLDALRQSSLKKGKFIDII